MNYWTAGGFAEYTLLSKKIFHITFPLYVGYGEVEMDWEEGDTELGKGNKQPLIVGLGGSEGGNTWSSNYWKKTREQFIEQAYAFLAIGYFRANGTPDTLQKIAIEDVYNAIVTATKNRKVSKRKIAIVGGSRGRDLALLLGSYYKDITCVVGLVASNTVFPGNTSHFTTST
jgi:hypothetical protein